MTVQSMVTIVAPIPRPAVVEARRLIEALGNPATPAIRQAIAPDVESAFLHFASLHAIEGSDQTSGFLVLEFSADRSPAEAIRLVATRLGEALRPIFALSPDWRRNDDAEIFMTNHRVEIGHRIFDTVGLAFCGTPGKSVPVIDQEERLARRIATLLERQPAGLSPLRRLHDVRRTLGDDERWQWALEPASPPIAAPASQPTTGDKIRALAVPFLTTFAWPLLLLLVPLGAWLLWPESWVWQAHQPMAAGDWVRAAIQILWFVFKILCFAGAGLALALALSYFALRRAEKSDWLSERAPDAQELAAIFARENADGHVQNHMVSHTVLKPGLLRKLTVRLAFFAISRLTALNPKPGHLNDIGTIHFARWINLPGTRDFLFFSNYGGSWESYLEDFITKAHQGLTAIWSNTVGFPHTRNLFADGATDGERFKRYARQSMLHTPFWYCAYPRLTTANIRTNSLIRRGLASAMSEDEAVRWLALFGSMPRPKDKLETTQIQSLVFGGLGFKPYGEFVTIELGADRSANRAWLTAAMPDIAFNDGRYAQAPAVLTLAATASGLEKLGLPPQGLATFPHAFTAGMAGPGRDRILGDIGENAPENWWWADKGADLALLIYGDSDDAVASLMSRIETLCQVHGGRFGHQIRLTPVGKTVSDRIEPFGFVDGVSQPAIRGTYRGLRNSDPIHLVEPGEFVLGYPDNRGNVPPGPTLDASFDADLRLPIAGQDQGFSECIAENPRMIGHNGSFLVIRQLEQHVDRFQAYCEAEGERLAPHVADLPLDHERGLADYVGAKLIGRWKDGSSLVRFPYVSATRLKELVGNDPSEGAARPEANPANALATAIQAASPPAPASPAEKRGASPIRPDNDFLFGTEDPQGLRCPYGSHIRRANPRDSLDPGSNEQITITNRHRIIRVGRGYGGTVDQPAGLMFMCLAGDIERQFEFIQQTWMGSTKFHGLDVETDPIVSDGQTGRCGFTVPTRAGPIALNPMPQFVTMRGGGYFFLPGKQLLDWLASSP
ncbi:hypothetical protein ACFB49_29490 [Sphingomonas sp. DBB INV C78]|uniref:Dyp-type peroxidase n=1 Tax=Sphingomonas sp. DBB INV C78 TaxID=3349434 RepID=UPI0036D21C40